MESLPASCIVGSRAGFFTRVFIDPENPAVRCLQEGKQGQTGALSFGQVAEALKRVEAGAALSDAAAAVSAAAEVTGNGHSFS